MLEEVYINCPYCGEGLWIELDFTGGIKQDLIEDCQVCCSPINIIASIDKDGNLELSAKREVE